MPQQRQITPLSRFPSLSLILCTLVPFHYVLSALLRPSRRWHSNHFSTYLFHLPESYIRMHQLCFILTKQVDLESIAARDIFSKNYQGASEKRKFEPSNYLHNSFLRETKVGVAFSILGLYTIPLLFRFISILSSLV